MSDPANQAKADRRARMRRTLATMAPEERRAAASSATRRLVGLDAFRKASVVMLYMAMETELDTTTIALRAFQLGKIVCVPRVDWQRRDIHAVEVSSFDDHTMELDEHGVRTPVGGRLVVPETIDLVVVPGLAYDPSGNRLGRGGGFYDRFLSRLRRSATKVGLAFDVQMIDEVPIEERDVRVDLIVTDRRVTSMRRLRSGH